MMKTATNWLFGFSVGFWLLLSVEADKESLKTNHINEVMESGGWSAWSQWTPCSRGCGGGVVLETRRCLKYKSPKATQLSTKSESKKESGRSCVGVYKRIRLCNNHNCPAGTKNSFLEQCEEFNGKPMIGGRTYTWEPFLNAPNQCGLNCRAVGHGFYATLKPTVKDGTPCKGPEKDKRRWMCISGICTHVGCDGILGSDKRLDSCGVCGGNNKSCRTISGIFTKPIMTVGYNPITQIPKGACNLYIAKVKPSKNHLVLRSLDGTFIVDGNLAFSSEEEIHSSGVLFTLKQDGPDQTETITSPGPLEEPLELMLMYHQPNTGIRYEYQLKNRNFDKIEAESSPGPQLFFSASNSTTVKESSSAENKNSGGSAGDGTMDDEAVKPNSKRRRKKFYWKLTGYTECSKSCAGGTQQALNICIREANSMIVADKRCSGLDLPQPQTQRCNVKPCPPFWEPADWSECSASCGEGFQKRKLLCRQEITSSLTLTVPNGACLSEPPSNVSLWQPCSRGPCSTAGVKIEEIQAKSSWKTDAWSPCSASCGLGLRNRSVTCNSVDNQLCPVSTRPHSQEVCDMGPCLSTAPAWFTTDWTEECSTGCGIGVQTRKVFCSAGHGKDNLCDLTIRPPRSRSCSSDKLCNGQWFAGPWSQCSETCGWGHQTRFVICLAYQNDQFSITKEINCPQHNKPVHEQVCQNKFCVPQWYSGDWTTCSQSCGTGFQRRELLCLDDHGKISTECEEPVKPVLRRSCNLHSCPTAPALPEKFYASYLTNETVSVIDEKAGSLGDQAALMSEKGPEEECKNQFKNCYLVVQARLCKYKYYRTACCIACKDKNKN